MMHVWLFLVTGAWIPPILVSFSVDGEISLLDEKSPSKDGHESQLNNLRNTPVHTESILNFTYHIDFEDSESLLSMDIIIQGNGLKVPRNLEGIVSIGYAAWSDIVMQKIKIADDRTSITTGFVNNGVEIMNIHGFFLMELADDFPALIDSQIIIIPIPKPGQEAESATLSYLSLAPSPPEVTPFQADPSKLAMRDATSLRINITFPPMNIEEAYVKLYLPYIDETDEAKLTYSHLQVSTGNGIPDEIQNKLLQHKADPYSRTSTSEESTSVYTFPKIKIPGNSAEPAVISFTASAELQDYTNFKDGEMLETAFGLKVNQYVWVSRARVHVADPRLDLQPRLQIALLGSQRISEGEKTKFRTKLTISHPPESNGTAYNVTASLYLDPLMTVERKGERVFDVIRPFEIDIGDGAVHFRISRIAFQHTSRFVFNITVPLNIHELLETKLFYVVYEVVYSGWRTEEVFGTALEILSHEVIGIPIDKDGPLEIGMTCPCPYDLTQLTCVCCRSDVCPCGLQDPYRCSECNDPWSCIATIQGYSQSVILVDNEGDMFSCNSRENARPAKPYVSCFKTGSNKTDIALSPLVGTIVGMDWSTFYLYGVGNNGRGYVMSMDGGSSWVTIPDEMYYVALQANFVNATFY